MCPLVEDGGWLPAEGHEHEGDETTSKCAGKRNGGAQEKVWCIVGLGEDGECARHGTERDQRCAKGMCRQEQSPFKWPQANGSDGTTEELIEEYERRTA